MANKYFVDENEIIEKEIDGEVYKLKELNAGQDQDAVDEVIKVDPQTKKVDINFKKNNQFKILSCLVDTPFKIPTRDGEIPWTEGTNEQKINTIKKLKPKLFKQIIKEIDNINGGDDMGF